MIKYLLTLGTALLSITAAGQEHLQHCATDAAMNKVYERHPELKQKLLDNSRRLQLQAGRTATVPNSTFVIPIVFHILHLGGAENVSDAQVRDAVRILNRDFAKQNADTVEIIPEFKSLADSTKIQFVLPGLDPSGNCTNGIIHHYSADTDWNDLSPTLFSFTWDPTRYMNVYLVRSITMANGFPAAGYTYFPGTWPTGDNFDAIVVLNNYIGSIGTSSAFLSRVLTHETGHWLGLPHVFGLFQTAGIDCSDDDFISDTPPTIGYGVCPDPLVPAQYQICTPGVSENFQNYMDYSYCCRMFTQEQCQRMQGTLGTPVVGRNNLSANSNLIATGVLNPGGPCAPIAEFTSDRIRTCAGTPVVFTDASQNGSPTAYSWTFQGGTPGASSASVQAVTYASPGVYSVTYTVSNPTGTGTINKNNLITVVPTTASYINNWTEGFESQQVFANDWSTASSSGSGKWERTGTAFFLGASSARISRLYNTRRNVSSMTGPAVDISSLSNPVLSFRVAAAESVPHRNALKVYASTDCGVSWTLLYNKTSPVLVTNPTTVPDFVPAVAADWRTEVISLSALSPASYVNFKFEYERDTIASANNIYIDNINLGSTTALAENPAWSLQELSLFPNPSKGEVTMSFSLPAPQKLKFILCDLLGRELEVLAEKEFAAGAHEYRLDLKNRPAGAYFLRTEASGSSRTRKLLIEE